MNKAADELGMQPRIEVKADEFDAIVVKALEETSALSAGEAQRIVATARRRAYKQTDRDTYQAMEGSGTGAWR